MITIKNLEKRYLGQACSLLQKVFPEDDIAPKSFIASLDRNKFNDFIKISPLTKSLEFYVALDKEENVLGTAGLYILKEDCKDSYWLGWYCVDSKKRGLGIGRLLLNHCINKATKSGKKYLKLRTSTAPQESKAQKIYDLNGFKIYEDSSEYIQKQKAEKDGAYNKIFRRKRLS